MYTKVEWANNLLQEQHFIDSVQSLRQVQLDVFENSSPDDIEARQIAYYKLSAINDLVSHIEAIAAQTRINEQRMRVLGIFSKS